MCQTKAQYLYFYQISFNNPAFVTRTHILQSGLTLKRIRCREPVLKSYAALMPILFFVKRRGQISPQMSHLKKTVANITHFSKKISVLCFSIYKPHRGLPQRNYVYL